MKNLGINEKEASWLCGILTTNSIALLTYAIYRGKLAYRLLKEERSFLKENGMVHEARATNKVTIKDGYQADSRKRRITIKHKPRRTSRKLWNIFYEKGHTIPKVTLTRLLAERMAITKKQAKEILKTLEKHDIIMTITKSKYKIIGVIPPPKHY